MTGAAEWRLKPVVVSAIRWTGANLAEIQAFAGGVYFDVVDPEDRDEDLDMTAEVFDKLHSTWVHVYDGQWIIRGVQGELYPCAADVFAATYEPASEPLTASQCDRLRQMADDHGNAVEAVRDALEYADARISTLTGAEIIAKAREALKVLEGSEEGTQ